MKSETGAIEIIPNKLYWISDRSPPKNEANAFYFCIDNELIYQPFCSDFGPLNLGMTYKFCVELNKLMHNPSYSSYKIYHYTSLIPGRRSNAACLMGAYQILFLNRSAEEAWAPFASLPPFIDYRDAGYGGCTYKCSILHCLRGLQTAVELGWFDIRTFNVKEYEFYERVENGDWNWIIPGKMLAFACPANVRTDAEGFRVWTPEDFSELFVSLGITAVVRLNNKTYEEERFIENGLRHYDLYFIDGSTPSYSIIENFLNIAEKEKALAIHCKAGLGRTGTLIGCYCMKHYGFRAADFIGWARLCRPGSVLGPQEQFLNEIEEECYEWGRQYRAENEVVNEFRVRFRQNLSVRSHIEEAKLERSPEEEFVETHGDKKQGTRLVTAKRVNQSNPGSPVSPTKNGRLS